MAITAGSRLGRYVIVRQLGAGAMGEVYLAEDPHIDRRVAIKTIRPDTQMLPDDQLRRRFEREAKAAGRLVHPHVVTLFDAGEVDGLLYLAFEYVEGPDLRMRAAQQPPLTLHDIVRIGREAASALDAAHRVGIIHRDIKPSNLLLTTDGSLKIADFGIATMVDQGTHLTHTGALIGTPQYLSPEQVSNEVQLDGRSDLFSLGIVLYELLAGRRPFDAGSVAALVYTIMASDPPALATLRPDLPPRLTAAIMRLLAKNRDDRFSTAGALGDELAAIERELDAESSEVTAESVPTKVIAPTVSSTTPAQTAAASPLPSTRIEAPAIAPAPATAGTARSHRGAFIAALFVVVIIIVLGGIFAAMKWRGHEAAKNVATGTGGTTGTVTISGGVSPVLSTATSPQQTASTETLPDHATQTMTPSAVESARAVSDVVTFDVLPTEASNVAVVKVDGLVRGLAADSATTLRPGRHVIVISGEGYEPLELVVESRSDVSGPTRIPVQLQPR